MRGAILRLSPGVTAAGIVGLGLRRLAWADNGEQVAAAQPPPQKPGIYQKAGFDPSAIEAVAELVRSQSRAQMAQKKADLMAGQQDEREKASQYKAASRELSARARNERRQQDAATRDEQRRQDVARSQFKSQLAVEREAAAQRLDEVLKEGEESEVVEHEKRLEAIRRETAQVEAALRLETEAKYVEAKATFTARAERQLQDLRLSMLRERGAAARDAALEALRASLATLGAGCAALLGDQQRMAALVTVVAAATLGVTAARQAARVAGNVVEARLKKPTLVRETSRGYALASSSIVPGSVGRATSRLAASFHSSPEPAAVVLEGAAFEPELAANLINFAQSAANTRKHGAPFRHALLHGPPGTGKTMFAKKLAQSAGMDYAILSGGDVLPLGRDAVTEIHKLFDWARTSPRGLLLLVDEADAFCRSRANTHMSEDARNALNAFLYRTGTPTRDVLVVFATNAPELFDPGILDRVDAVIRFGLPAQTERERILKLGLGDFAVEADDAAASADVSPLRRLLNMILGRRPPRPVVLDGVTSGHVQYAATQTDGFSAREVAKLAIAWGAAAVGESPTTPTLTPALMKEVTLRQIDTTLQKQAWYAMAYPAPEID